MKKVLFFISLFSFLVIVSFVLYFHFASTALYSSENKELPFVVNQGDGLRLISKRLKDNHLIRDPLIFVINANLLGLNTKLQAGSFSLSPSMTTNQIIRRLSKGGSHDYWA